MSTPKLDDAIRDAYAALSPPARLSAATLRARREARFRRSAWGAAVVAVAAAIVTIVVTVHRQGSIDDGLPERLADEVWRHYLVLKPPEVRGDAFPTLAAQMPRLDFDLLGPKLPAALRTEGARYCSLDGELAAQVQLRDDRGLRYALYVTRARPKFAPLSDHHVGRSGGAVRIWREAGLLYALAGPLRGTPTSRPH